MKVKYVMAALAVFMLVVALAHPAEAKKLRHYVNAATRTSIAAAGCLSDNNGRTACYGDNKHQRQSASDGIHREGHSGHRPSGRSKESSVSLAGIVSPLAEKIREIQSECGSIIVSAYRPGARIPTGQLSNHALHRAVDVQGNPKCIYAHLKGWPGGYSTDYASAPEGPHVHVSYNPGGMEWGARFVHYHGGGHRHARLRHHRIALR